MAVRTARAEENTYRWEQSLVGLGEGELRHEARSGICEPLRNPLLSPVTVRLVPFGDSFHKPGALLWRCPGLHELEGRGRRTEDGEQRTEKGDDKIAINAEQRPARPSDRNQTRARANVMATPPTSRQVHRHPHSAQHTQTSTTHTLLDVTQRKPRQAVSLIGEYPCVLLDVQDIEETVLSYTDNAARSLSEIWQDNYLSIHTTTKAATQRPTAEDF